MYIATIPLPSVEEGKRIKSMKASCPDLEISRTRFTG
jgi:hypothetical protein